MPEGINPDMKKIESAENPGADLNIEYSREHDVHIVRETLAELAWLRQQGYKIHLPAKIEALVAQGSPPTEEQITAAVSSEFRLEEYEAKSQAVMRDWTERKGDFLQKLATLGLPLQSKYELLLTKYGVGGSYHRPNRVDANMHDPYTQDVLTTLFHEIIHLTIEDVIEEGHVDHWTKERLVDLIFGRFFPDKKELQQDPHHAKRIGELFDQFFPDIKQCIIEVAKLSKENRAEPEAQ